MRIATALLALHLAAPAPDGAPTEEARRGAALRLHEEQHYTEAAAQLEELAEQTGRSDHLFDAGQSRFAAGHRAHALRLWQIYASDPRRTPEDLALVGQRIAAARALTTSVELVLVVPKLRGPLALTIRRRYDPADQPRPPLRIDDLPAPVGGIITTRVTLDPGVWELDLTEGPRLAERRELHLDRSESRLELSLADAAADTTASPAPPPLDPPAAARPAGARLRVALLATSAALAVGGVTLAVLGPRRQAASARACAGTSTAPSCTETAILGAVRLTDAGAGLLGAGAGVLVTGLVAARPGRRAWIAGLVAGASALVGGAAWLAASNGSYGAGRSNEAYLAELAGWSTRRAVAAALLGLGAGLSFGSASTALSRPRRTRPSIAIAPTPWGVGASGSF